MKFKGFCLVSNIFSLPSPDQIILNKSLLLRKADSIDIQWFKPFLDNFHSPHKENFYEYIINPEENGFSKKTKLKRKDWRYTVLEYNQIVLDDETKIALKLSLLDIDPVIEIFIELGEDGDWGSRKDDYIPYNLLNDDYLKYRKYGSELYLRSTPTLEEIADFNKILHIVRHVIKRDDPSESFLLKAVKDYISIHTVPNASPFKLLSFFSILESLITYTPQNHTDTIISKQLARKTSFLYENFEFNFIFKDFFKGSETNTIETIIEKLYNYRNDIAHGNIPKMDSKLKILKTNFDKILPFMNLLLRNILRIAIEKPQVIISLKKI